MWIIFKVFIEFVTTLLPFSVLVSWPKAYVILVPGESESHSVVSDSLTPHGLSQWNSPAQNTGVGSLSPLQGIFPTQGSNPGLPHCGQILYQLSHKGSARILEWIAYPFSSGSSRPRNQTRRFLYQLTELWGSQTRDQTCTSCIGRWSFNHFICISHVSDTIQYLSFSVYFAWYKTLYVNLYYCKMAGLPYFLRLSNIPLCKYTCICIYTHTVSLSIHLSVETKVVSISWLL